MAQDSTVVRPADAQDAVVIEPDDVWGGGGGGGGGGVSLVEWTKLTSTEEGSSPNDVNGIGDTGTSFTAGDFRTVFTAFTTDLDGYREDPLWWSKKLLDLYPDFDPETDMLELMLDITQFAVGANDGAGVFVGITDNAGLASGDTPNAAIAGLHRSGVSNHRLTRVNTFNPSTAANGGQQDQLYISLQFVDASGTWRPIGVILARNQGSSPPTYLNGAYDFTTMETTLGDWYIVCGNYHDGTSDPSGVDIRWNLYHRIVERASGQVA